MDPYLYPGTHVLRNLRDIRDSRVLSEYEAEATARRLRQLEQKSLSGEFDSRRLQSIHLHIFQDVYAWSGKFRTVEISKSGDPFAFREHIAISLDRTFAELNRESALSGANREGFANRSAYYLGEINAVHPFRDGNGRTQREFVRQLAVANGLRIDWSRIAQEEMIAASRRSLRVDNAELVELLRRALKQ